MTWTELTPLGKVMILAGPALSIIFCGVKLAGMLPNWSWWWAALPLPIGPLLMVGIAVAVNIRMEG